MVIEARSLVDITQDAFEVLYKEIGIVNTLRFISQFTMGYGDYTREREELFAGLTLKDIVTEVKRRRDSTRSRQ